jgi:Ca-activated chloride channel homolog
LDFGDVRCASADTVCSNFPVDSPRLVSSRAGAAGSGWGTYTIAVDVDLVVFNVTVTDSRGRHVSGLRASEFGVYEEDRLQNITFFNAEDGPATVGLIIDNSGSMRAKRTDVVNAPRIRGSEPV